MQWACIIPFSLLLLVGAILGQELPPWLEEIGTTSSGKTFYISKEGVKAHWLGAHFEVYKWSANNPIIGLAAIESYEEAQLLDEYFEKFGNNSQHEHIWTSGTSMGSHRPWESLNLKWSTTQTQLVGGNYSNFYPRTSLSPAGMPNWIACVSGQYGIWTLFYTFFWHIKPCTDEYRYLVQKQD